MNSKSGHHTGFYWQFMQRMQLPAWSVPQSCHFCLILQGSYLLLVSRRCVIISTTHSYIPVASANQVNLPLAFEKRCHGLQDGGNEPFAPFASDSDRDVEISSSRSAPETSYSMDMPRPSTSQTPLTSAAPPASTSGKSHRQTQILADL